MQSPLPKKKTISKITTFPEVLKDVLDGKRATKVEWANSAEYILLYDGFLCIHHSSDDGTRFHRLLVSEGDLRGEDWLVITEEERETKRSD